MNLRSKLFSLYWWLESLIDPGTRSTQYRYADALSSLIDDHSLWLDLGCGHAIFPDWVSNHEALIGRARRAVGLDYDWESLRKHNQISRLVRGDTASLPFMESSFNRISANMLVEHMTNPAGTLKEIHRILRPGGIFLYHTPNARFYMTKIATHLPQSIKDKLVWLFERRAEADIFPTHYRMNRLQDIYRLANDCKFRVLRCDSLNTSSAGNIFLGPLVLVELLIRRVLRHERFQEFRSNFIVVLEKP